MPCAALLADEQPIDVEKDSLSGIDIRSELNQEEFPFKGRNKIKFSVVQITG
jgi:hypothetical protein